METTVTLEQVRLYVANAVSKQQLEMMEPKAEVFFNAMARHFVITLHGYLWGEHVGEKIIEHPRDWWQAFKERWFPMWALKRWPVIHTIHHVNIKAVYPDFKIAMPDKTHTFIARHWTCSDLPCGEED